MRYFLGFLLIILSSNCFGNEVIKIRGNRPGDTRSTFQNVLLKKICLNTIKKFGKCSVDTSVFVESRDRAKAFLKEGKIHVAGEASRLTWEKDLLFVPIPILKGLLGLTVFLINKENQPVFDKISNLDQLKKEVSIGLGEQWSNTKVFKEFGFKVITSNNYEGLFKMLKVNRFKAFPRSVSEVMGEYNSKKVHNKSLVIEKKLSMFLPLPKFFFVSPKKPKLKERIQYGLELMIKNGSFDKLFYRFHSKALKGLKFKNRTILIIKNNPFLSEISNNALKRFRFTKEEIIKLTE